MVLTTWMDPKTQTDKNLVQFRVELLVKVAHAAF